MRVRHIIYNFLFIKQQSTPQLAYLSLSFVQNLMTTPKQERIVVEAGF